jgi:hypothetical protein
MIYIYQQTHEGISQRAKKSVTNQATPQRQHNRTEPHRRTWLSRLKVLPISPLRRLNIFAKRAMHNLLVVLRLGIRN